MQKGAGSNLEVKKEVAQGNTTVTGIASDSSYQFTGRENDGDGLDYYRARYYNPIWERFIQEDPLGFDGGDADLYRYVGDDPISYADPMGLWPLPFGQGYANSQISQQLQNNGMSQSEANQVANDITDAMDMSDLMRPLHNQQPFDSM